MELKTMQAAKDFVAKERGYWSWNEALLDVDVSRLDSMTDEAMKLYALQIAEAARRMESDNIIDAINKVGYSNEESILWVIENTPQPDIDKLLK